MSETARRPFGVGFLSIVIIVVGALQIGSGIAILTHKGDDALVDALDVSSSDVSTIAWVVIATGVIGMLVGFALRGGANWARTLIGILAALNAASLIWAAISYHSVHWYTYIWSTVLYVLVAGYLFFDEDAKSYFER